MLLQITGLPFFMAALYIICILVVKLYMDKEYMEIYISLVMKLVYNFFLYPFTHALMDTCIFSMSWLS